MRGAKCATCLAKVETAASAAPGRGAGEAQPDHRQALGDLQRRGAAIPPRSSRRSTRPAIRRPVRSLHRAGGGRRRGTPPYAGARRRRLRRRQRDDVLGADLGRPVRPGARRLRRGRSCTGSRRIVATPCALYAGRIFFQSRLALAAARQGQHGRADLHRRAAHPHRQLLRDASRAAGTPISTPPSRLVFLLLIGRWLDHQLRAKAAGAARDLLALQAPAARRLDARGARARARRSAQVAVGDRIAVAPGERVPVDGLVVEGASSLDNALITGETAPWPVARRRGRACRAR